MADQLQITDTQLQQVLSAIGKVGGHNAHWDYTNAIPTFLGALLGFAAAILLDRLKTRRERESKMRERQEGELAKLSGTNTMLAFNVETLIHTAMQQIIPHYESSHAALNEIRTGQSSINQNSSEYVITPNMQSSMRRCPEPNLAESDFFADLSFLLRRNAELLKHMGWVNTYVRDLKFILKERNKLIDVATIGAQEDITRSAFERQIEHQTNVSIPEIVNCYQLLKAIERTMKGLSEVASNHYKHVDGPKLGMKKPPIYDVVMGRLEDIVKTVVPDFPPEEPT